MREAQWSRFAAEWVLLGAIAVGHLPRSERMRAAAHNRRAWAAAGVLVCLVVAGGSGWQREAAEDRPGHPLLGQSLAEVRLYAGSAAVTVGEIARATGGVVLALGEAPEAAVLPEMAREAKGRAVFVVLPGETGTVASTPAGGKGVLRDRDGALLDLVRWRTGRGVLVLRWDATVLLAREGTWKDCAGSVLTVLRLPQEAAPPPGARVQRHVCVCGRDELCDAASRR